MKRIILCSILTMLVPTLSIASILDSVKGYMPSIPSWLSSKKESKVLHKKYALGPNSKIILKNIRGSVDIESKWEQNDVLLKAEIVAPKKEQLQDVKILDNAQSSHTDLTIKTCCENEKSKAQVNYYLIVPAQTAVYVSNDEGPVSIRQVRGKICVTTTKGDISISEPSNMVVAHSTQQGNITIQRPDGNLKVSSARGKINIVDSSKSVVATAQNGSITMKASEIPARSKIKLANTSGGIHLNLPADVNADLRASTDRGVVTCQHEITLKPQVTTLDHAAWKQFKRSVNGTFGSGVSQIFVHSARSNITISKDEVRS